MKKGKESGKGTESFQIEYRSDTPERKGCRKQNWARRTPSHDVGPSKLQSTKRKAPEQCLTEEFNGGQKWPTPNPHIMPSPRLGAAWGEWGLNSDTVTDPESDVARG